jgi:NIPSNAP
MKTILLLAACLSFLMTTAPAADPDTRLFEMRTYYANPGKLDALHARFRDHTIKLFEKHGIANIGYWVPIENTENKLIYVLAYPDRPAREVAWKEFGADPDWKKAQKESELDGKLVSKVEQLFMNATDYGPEIKPGVGAGERVFELRTYTCPPGNLPILDARFREHTVKLFERYGMKNIAYWHPASTDPRSQTTLVYLLAHASADAGKASFDAFRADPEWIEAKKASEEKAGGSVTVPTTGVQSVYLKATDYSPMH